MNINGSSSSPIPIILSLIWCFIILAAYFYFNAQYYTEKISAFGEHFARMLGF